MTSSVSELTYTLEDVEAPLSVIGHAVLHRHRPAASGGESMNPSSRVLNSVAAVAVPVAHVLLADDEYADR